METEGQSKPTPHAAAAPAPAWCHPEPAPLCFPMGTLSWQGWPKAEALFQSMTSNGMEPSLFGWAGLSLLWTTSCPCTQPAQQGTHRGKQSEAWALQAQVSTRGMLVYFQHWPVTSATQSTKGAVGCLPAPGSPVMSQPRPHTVWSQEPLKPRWLLQHLCHHLPPGRSLLCPGGCVPVPGILLLAVGLGLLPRWPLPGRQHSCIGRRTRRLAGELRLAPR